MNAPRDKVMKRLLKAHEYRTKQLFQQYLSRMKELPTVSAAIAENIDMKGNGNGQEESLKYPDGRIKGKIYGLQQINSTRQYHQLIMVGFIEACKGIQELYEDRDKITEDTEQILTDVNLQEKQVAFQALQVMLKDSISQYTNIFISTFKLFFEYYEEHYGNGFIIQELLSNLEDHRNDNISAADNEKYRDEFARLHHSVLLYNGSDTNDNPDSNSSLSDVNRFELQDNRNAWLLLARQAVLDVKFVDNSFEDCGKQLKISSNFLAPLVTVFFDQIIGCILQHNITMMEKHLKAITQHFFNEEYMKCYLITLPQFHEKFAVSGQFASPNLQFRQNFNNHYIPWMKDYFLPLLAEYVIENYNLILTTYFKPLIDIFDASDILDNQLQNQYFESLFLDALHYYIESLTINVGIVTDFNIQQLPTESMPINIESSYISHWIKHRGHHRHQHKHSHKVSRLAQNKPIATNRKLEEEEDIFSKSPLPIHTSMDGSRSTLVNKADLSSLFFALLFNYFSEHDLIQECITLMSSHEFVPTLTVSSDMRNSLELQVVNTSRIFSLAFLDKTMSQMEKISMEAMRDAFHVSYSTVTQTIGNGDSLQNTKLNLHDSFISIAKFLDQISLLAYLVSAELLPILPPNHKLLHMLTGTSVTSTGNSFEAMRRSSSINMGNAQHRSSLLSAGSTMSFSSNHGHNYSNHLSQQSFNLQMDIERLFSQKIVVTPPIHRLLSVKTDQQFQEQKFGNLTTEHLIGSLIKV
jgi:hypothetical protein